VKAGHEYELKALPQYQQRMHAPLPPPEKRLRGAAKRRHMQAVMKKNIEQNLRVETIGVLVSQTARGLQRLQMVLFLIRVENLYVSWKSNRFTSRCMPEPRCGRRCRDQWPSPPAASVHRFTGAVSSRRRRSIRSPLMQIGGIGTFSDSRASTSMSCYLPLLLMLSID